VSIVVIVPLFNCSAYTGKDVRPIIEARVRWRLNRFEPANVKNSLFKSANTVSFFMDILPKAEVTLRGQGIFDQTTANDKGYFEFS